MAGRYPNPNAPRAPSRPHPPAPSSHPAGYVSPGGAMPPAASGVPGQRYELQPPQLQQASQFQQQTAQPQVHASPPQSQAPMQPLGPMQPQAPMHPQAPMQAQAPVQPQAPMQPQTVPPPQHQRPAHFQQSTRPVPGQQGPAHPVQPMPAQVNQAPPHAHGNPGLRPQQATPSVQQQRPIPPAAMRPVPSHSQPTRPVPPGMSGITAAMGASSLSDIPSGLPQTPSDPRFQQQMSNQVAPNPHPHLHQQSQLQAKVASVADPNFLPRPDFSPDAVVKRIAQGDPSVSLPLENVAPPPMHGVRVGANEPAACPSEVFVPASGRNVRLCTGAFPASVSLAKKYAMPLGAVIHPLAEPAEDEPGIPVVNFGATGIVRCRRCRSYINFSCRFTDAGRRWVCSMCQYPNDCPNDYFAPLDQNGRRRDAAQRPELHRGSIEFVAPAEYMVRPPMPPIYMFVLEVSPASMASGALVAMISGIKASINAIPNEGRTRVGLITFNSSVQFYSLPSGEDVDPSVSVVADITDMFIPTPENILVQLADCRTAFEKALDLILASCKSVQMNAQTVKPPASSASCLGAALQGAQKVMEHYGGKISVLAASRPTIGPGALKDRSENNALGTDRERAVLRTDSTFYRQMAVEFSKYQISVDLFLCPPPPAVFMDVATLAQLAKFTGGELFRAAGFEAHRDHARLQRLVYRTLSRVTGFEAVMRIRATKSVRCSQFHGRFFVRSTDLLALPNVDSDKAYAVQFAFDESSINDGPFCVQVALLYTTTGGERRIRVHTVAVPITSSISDLFCRVDAPATANIFLRIAAEAVKDRVLDELKKSLTDKVVTALAAYRTVCQQQYQGMGGGAGTGHFYLPDAMNLLPLYMHGLLRTGILSRDTAGALLFRFDDKSTLIHAVDTMNIAMSTSLLYPNMIMALPPPAASSVANGGAVKPVFSGGLPATCSSFKADSALLVDDGQTLILWLGASIVQSFAAELLGVAPQSIGSGVDPRQLAYHLMENVERKGVVAHVRSMVNRVLASRPAGTGFLVLLAGGPMQARVEALCVEDRSASSISYKDVLTEFSRQVAAKAAGQK